MLVGLVLEKDIDVVQGHKTVDEKYCDLLAGCFNLIEFDSSH